MTDIEFLDSLKNNNEALLTATRDNAADFFASPKTNEELYRFFAGRAMTSHLTSAYSGNDVHRSNSEDSFLHVTGYLAEKNAAEKFFTLANYYSDTPKTMRDFIVYHSENRILTGNKLFGEYMSSEERPASLLFLWVMNLCIVEVMRELKKTLSDEYVIDVLSSLIEDKIRSINVVYTKLLNCLPEDNVRSLLESKIDNIRKDFYELSKNSTSDLESSRTLVNTTYGWEY